MTLETVAPLSDDPSSCQPWPRDNSGCILPEIAKRLCPYTTPWGTIQRAAVGNFYTRREMMANPPSRKPLKLIIDFQQRGPTRPDAAFYPVPILYNFA
jgi:hypothetical protein